MGTSGGHPGGDPELSGLTVGIWRGAKTQNRQSTKADVHPRGKVENIRDPLTSRFRRSTVRGPKSGGLAAGIRHSGPVVRRAGYLGTAAAGQNKTGHVKRAERRSVASEQRWPPGACNRGGRACPGFADHPKVRLGSLPSIRKSAPQPRHRPRIASVAIVVRVARWSRYRRGHAPPETAPLYIIRLSSSSSTAATHFFHSGD
jgi:hypothetical protein